MQCSKTRHCGGKGGTSVLFCNTDDELGGDLSPPVFSSSACCKIMHLSPPQSAALFVWVSRVAALYRFATAIERSISQQCCVSLQRSSVRFRNSVAFRYSVGRAQRLSTRELLQNATVQAFSVGRAQETSTRTLLQNATVQAFRGDVLRFATAFFTNQVSIQAVVDERSLTHKM